MFKTRIKTWVLVLFLFIICDVFLRQYLPMTISEKDLRPVKKDVNYTEVIARRISNDSGSKIVFIGDSQMYGSGVLNENESVPGHFRSLSKGNKMHIYNLAGKGYGPGEVFYQLNYLKGQKIDILVYNLSLSWLNRTKFTENNGIGVLSGFKPLEPEDRRRTPEEFIANISHQWYLRAHKNYIKYELMKTLGKNGPPDLDLATKNPNLDNPATLKKLIGENFGGTEINDSNMAMLNKTLNQLDDLSKHGTKVIIYVSPQNKPIFERIDKWNANGVKRNVAKVKKLVESHGFEFYNFVESIPGQYFIDSIHMDSNGNRILAGRLNEIITAKGGIK